MCHQRGASRAGASQFGEAVDERAREFDEFGERSVLEFRNFGCIGRPFGARLKRQLMENVNPLEALGQPRVPADQVAREGAGEHAYIAAE